MRMLSQSTAGDLMTVARPANGIRPRSVMSPDDATNAYYYYRGYYAATSGYNRPLALPAPVDMQTTSNGHVNNANNKQHYYYSTMPQEVNTRTSDNYTQTQVRHAFDANKPVVLQRHY